MFASKYLACFLLHNKRWLELCKKTSTKSLFKKCKSIKSIERCR